MEWRDLNNAQILALYGTVVEGYTLYEEQLPNMTYYYKITQLDYDDLKVILNWYRDSLEYGFDWDNLISHLESYDDESFGSMFHIAHESIFRYKHVMEFLANIEKIPDESIYKGALRYNYDDEIEDWYFYVLEKKQNPKYKKEFMKWNDLRNSQIMAFYETGFKNRVYYYNSFTKTCHYPYSYIHEECPPMFFYHKNGAHGLSREDKNIILEWYNDSLSYGINWERLSYKLFTGDVQMLVEQKEIFEETMFRVKTAIAYQRQKDIWEEEEFNNRGSWDDYDDSNELDAVGGEEDALWNID